MAQTAESNVLSTLDGQKPSAFYSCVPRNSGVLEVQDA